MGIYMTEETEISRISRLAEAVRKVRGGDFSLPIETSGKNDDLDILANEICQMVECLKEQADGRKAAKDAQRDCEERYRRLQANIPGMVYTFAQHPDGTFSFPYVNEASRQLFDIAPEDLMGDVSLITRLIHPDDRKKFASSIKRSAETLQPWREIVRHIVNGEVRWYDCMSRPEKQANGDVLWDGIILEITERKRAEEALRVSENRFRMIVETAEEGIWQVDREWKTTYVNRRMEQMLVCEPGTMLGTGIHEFMDDEGRRNVAELISRREQGLNETHDFRFVRRDGSLLDALVSASPLIDERGAFVGSFAMVTDITERKRAEDSLRESEHRYREVFENSSECIFLLDVTADGRFKFAGFNPAEEKAVGFLSAETSGKFVEELLPEGLARQVVANYRRCVLSGTIINYEEKLDLPVGVRYFQTVLIPVRNAMGDIYRIIGISRDTTESRRVEEALRQAKLVVEKSPVVLFRWRAAEGWPVEMVSGNVLRYGYTPEELLSGAVPFSSILYSEDIERVAAEVEEYSRSGVDSFQQEYRIVTREGDVCWVDDRTVVERDDEGKVTHYQGIVIDITDRKRTESVIAARIRLLQFATTHTLDELLEATLNEVEELTGSCIGFYHYLEPDQQTLRLQNWSTRTKKEFCTAQGKGLHYNVSAAGVWVDCVRERRPIIHNDYASLLHRKGLPPGHPPVVRELVVPVFSGENIVAILGVGNKQRDYTQQDVEMVSLLADLAWEIVERMRAEDALKISERKYRTIIEHAPFGICSSTIGGKLVSVNPALAGILKYDSPEDLLETVNCSSIQKVLFVKPSEREAVVNRVFEGSAWHIFDCQYRCKDGSVITCKVHSRRILDQEGSEREFESYLENITDRVEAEKALRESEEKFRVLAETAPAAIVVYQDEKFVYVNPAAVRLFGYGESELLGMNFWEWAHPDNRTMVMDRGKARQRGEQVPIQYEQRFVNKSGEVGWVMVSAGAITYRGNPAGIATFIDITGTKRTEERIHAALAEKVVLLKEVHHRVKNNLQIISSLLELQSDYIEGEGSKRFIRESQDRIRSMALVHEQLYKSEDLSVIDFAGYVDELVMSLYRSSVVDQDKILAVVEVRDIELGIDEAIPCGLIINELVSNSLKHAFPGNRRGSISIRGFLDEGGYVCLTVSDTGIGLSPGFDLATLESLGLQIVSLLTKQLHGSLDIRGDNGMAVCIRFKSIVGK
jgi:PAS domain S-box-containing protein